MMNENLKKSISTTQIILDSFEKVSSFKNYFPHNNSKVILQMFNEKNGKMIKSMRLNNKKERRLGKYSFFVEEMKRIILLSKNKGKKSIFEKSPQKRKNMLFKSLQTITTFRTKKKKITKEKMLGSEIKFSDVVLLVMKNPSWKKKLAGIKKPAKTEFLNNFNRK